MRSRGVDKLPEGESHVAEVCCCCFGYGHLVFTDIASERAKYEQLSRQFSAKRLGLHRCVPGTGDPDVCA